MFISGIFSDQVHGGESEWSQEGVPFSGDRTGYYFLVEQRVNDKKRGRFSLSVSSRLMLSP